MDTFDLDRFVRAQESTYDDALREIRNGRKQSHWMWFIFPQIDGLGYSAMSKKYSIKSLDEAKAYLAHPVLGARLRECAEALLKLQNKSADEIFGSVDAAKLKSSATLFGEVEKQPFQAILEKYFAGEGDARTLELMVDRK